MKNKRKNRKVQNKENEKEEMKGNKKYDKTRKNDSFGLFFFIWFDLAYQSQWII